MERKNKKDNKEYKNITIHGFMTSGKTTCAKIIAKKLKMNFFDTDIIFEKKYGKITDFVLKYGFKKFRKIEKDIFKKLLKKQNAVISCGGGIFPKRKKNTLTVSLIPPFIKLEKRLIKHNKTRPLLKNFPENKKNMIELYKKRKKEYQKADIIIKETDINKITRKIINIWKSN